LVIVFFQNQLYQRMGHFFILNYYFTFVIWDDVIKVEAVLREFTEGKESLFTKKEQEELGLTDENLEIEQIY